MTSRRLGDRVRSQVTGNPVACLALFVALSGTSYAAINLPRDSVGARELKPGAVGNAEVRKGALRVNRFRSGELPALKDSIVRTMAAAAGSSIVHATARCEAGEIVVGGGFLNQSAVSRTDSYEIIASAPQGEDGQAATGWNVEARAGEAGNIGDTPTAYVLCLPIG